MRPVIRYQSQLLFRKSYKPARILRIRPNAKPLTFRPSRSSVASRYDEARPHRLKPNRGGAATTGATATQPTIRKA